MARGINKVILVGTLGKDSEVRYNQSGGAVTRISLATNEKWKDKNGEMQERAEWHRVVFFGRLAEIAGEYLKKGGQVYIEGRLRTSSYDKEGVTHYSTDIIADEMMLLGGRQEGGERSESRPASRDSGRTRGSERPAPARSSYANPAPRDDEPFPDDDIPL